MSRKNKRGRGWKVYKLLIAGGLMLLLLTGYVFSPWQAENQWSWWYLLPLAGAFLLSSLVFAGFTAFDAVPPLREGRYRESLETLAKYVVVWLWGCYGLWMVLSSGQPNDWQRTRLHPFVSQLIDALPPVLTAEMQKNLSEKEDYQSLVRYLFSPFFTRNLLTLGLLLGGSILYGLRSRVVGRPRWVQDWLNQLAAWQRRSTAWATDNKDKLIHAFLWLVVAAALWEQLAVLRLGWLTSVPIVVLILFFYLNMAVLLRMLTTRAYFGGFMFLLFEWALILLFKEVALNRLHQNLASELTEFTAVLVAGAFVAALTERTNRINQDKVREVIRKQQAQIEALTYQINPHFLFNSLTFIHSRSQPYSAELAEAVQLLSDMMRYRLISPDQGLGVELAEEVQHLRDYIRFDQLIHSTNHIVFEQTGSVAHHRIAPKLLDIFVENAIKYGNLRDEQQPLVVQLTMAQNRLSFRVHNRKWAVPVKAGPPSSRTGLRNARNRLELIYPGRHQLVVQDEPQFFTVLLTLDL